MDIDELDKQAQDFLMFQAHDYDQNLKMDGLELLSALVHDHHYSSPEEEAKVSLHYCQSLTHKEICCSLHALVRKRRGFTGSVNLKTMLVGVFEFDQLI